MLARLLAFLFRRRADAHGWRGVSRTRAGDGPRQLPTGGSSTVPSGCVGHLVSVRQGADGRLWGRIVPSPELAAEYNFPRHFDVRIR